MLNLLKFIQKVCEEEILKPGKLQDRSRYTFQFLFEWPNLILKHLINLISEPLQLSLSGQQFFTELAHFVLIHLIFSPPVLPVTHSLV